MSGRGRRVHDRPGVTSDVIWRGGAPITSWARFHAEVKRPGHKLLARLDDFPDAVLVAGCQRSGTTAVARLLARAPGMADYRFGPDDELDAALILAGYAERPAAGRHCFQTTYVNDRFDEYFEHDDFSLVWMLREPHSVVYSMLHNWRRAALRRLFAACGAAQLGHGRRTGSAIRGWIGPSRFEMACAAYVGKTLQTLELVDRLGRDRLLVLDYDELVLRRRTLVPKVFEFARVPRGELGTAGLHSRSAARPSPFARARAEHIDRVCMPVYERALAAQTETPARRASQAV